MYWLISLSILVNRMTIEKDRYLRARKPSSWRLASSMLARPPSRLPTLHSAFTINRHRLLGQWRSQDNTTPRATCSATVRYSNYSSYSALQYSLCAVATTRAMARVARALDPPLHIGITCKKVELEKTTSKHLGVTFCCVHFRWFLCQFV